MNTLNGMNKVDFEIIQFSILGVLDECKKSIVVPGKERLRTTGISQC